MIVKEKDLSGETLNNYKIISKLGQGGMATVYKAHELSLNRVVALKVLSAQLSGDNDYIKRFEREAQAAAKLNHPNIVQIYSIGSEGELYYFAMEYIKGTSLSDIKQQDQIVNPAKAVTIIKQVADALGEAHKAGLVHRDIKPSNIMLDNAGRAKVTDFGIAYVNDAKTKLTRDGSIIGTPEYLSPEQCEGKTVDQRSDIYSLGVTLYELLSGRTPYMADTPVSMLMKIVKGEFPPLKEINPNVPDALNTIVGKMMETSVTNRYQSMEEVVLALDTVFANFPVNPSQEAAVQSTAVVDHFSSSMVEPQIDNFPPTEAGTQPPISPTVQRPEASATPVPVHTEKSGNKSAMIFIIIIVLLIGGAIAAKFLIFDKNQSPSSNNDQPPLVAGKNNLTATIPANTGNTAPMPGEEQPKEDKPGTLTNQTESKVDVKGNTRGTTAVSDGGSSPGIPDRSSSVQGQSSQPTPTTTEKASPPVSPSQPQITSKRAPNPKPLPPPKSCIISSVGEDDYSGLAAPYVQEILANRKFMVIDGPSVADRQLADVARNHIVISGKLLGTRTLQFHGRSPEQYTVRITLKVVNPRNGAIVAGPANKTVEYTALNAEDNLREAVTALMSRILPNLK